MTEGAEPATPAESAPPAQRRGALPAAPPSAPADPLAGNTLLAAPDQVLATLRPDGSRNWIRPRLSPGWFLDRRRALAWALMAFFVAAPWIPVGGKPLILLDVVRREFTLAGTTFRPTDTPLLMLLMLAIFVGVFLTTALFGRAWCGWACPQTVYMEFVFRPLERLFEGSPQQQARRDREGADGRRWLKNGVSALIAAFLANTFLAYFVGWEQLLVWMTHSPAHHPTAFMVMLTVTGLMVFDFVWFREQTCLVACPYGRLQAVLFDRDTWIVGYDARRGEPRGKLKKAPAAQPDARGDCIDCRACVTTCPTGIDIREGLQMECIGCAQCVDACDAIMDRVGRPRGLVRYTSAAELAGEPRRHLLRPRTVIYTAALVLLGGLLAAGLWTRPSTKVFALRGLDTPYAVLPTGEVHNRLRLKVHNLAETARTYTLEADGLGEGTLIAPEFPLTVGGGAQATTTVFVKLAPGAFDARGRRRVALRISDGEAFRAELPYTLLGPRRSP